MSLRTDQFFYNALRNNSVLYDEIDGRLFNTARPTVDEDEDRVPYIIIILNGGSNDIGTKDDVEGTTDTVNVSILVVANDREELADLTETVRDTCRDYLQSNGGTDSTAPIDWSFSFDTVVYDTMKPCLYQTLRYQCDTYRD